MQTLALTYREMLFEINPRATAYHPFERALNIDTERNHKRNLNRENNYAPTPEQVGKMFSDFDLERNPHRRLHFKRFDIVQDQYIFEVEDRSRPAPEGAQSYNPELDAFLRIHNGKMEYHNGIRWTSIRHHPNGGNIIDRRIIE